MSEVAATTKMVEQVGKLEEAELNTTTGETQPLPQNQAPASPEASPEGAPAEPASSPAETQPQPAQSTQPVEQAQKPVVEVISGTPPVAAQPAPAAEPAPTAAAPEAKPAEGLEVLGTFLKDQQTKTLEEARRSVQSQHDRQTALVNRQLEEATGRHETLKAEIRELQTQGLSDEDKAKVKLGWDNADERTGLEKFRGELDEANRAFNVDSLLFEYKDVDISRESLEAIKTPEEMELFCANAKSDFLQKKLTEAEAAPAAAPEATTQPASPPAPVQPAQAAAPVEAVPNAPGVPAGAQAPSDVGSGGASPEEKKFSEESSAEALQQNLRNTGWDTVRLRQA